MDKESAKAVLDWAKGTDLVELAWRKGSDRFSFSLAGTPPPAPVPVRVPVTRQVPVPCPGVGFYHAAAPGTPAKVRAGMRVETGGVLGCLEAGPDRREIRSPVAGTIVQILIEEGAPAQYGQPLFVLET